MTIKGVLEIITALFVIALSFADPASAILIAVVVLLVCGIHEVAAGARRGANRHALKIVHLQKALEFANEKGKITNDDLERFLGVSDATAERYLNELENEGSLTQVGKRGRGVAYKKTG